MSRQMRIAASLILTVCAVLLGMGAYAAESDGNRIAGVYEDESYGEDVILRITFHDTMTYVMEMDREGEILTVDSGSYALVDGGIQTFSETDDVFSVYYHVDGNRIFTDEEEISMKKIK